MSAPPEIPRETLDAVRSFMDIDMGQWPTVRFVVKPGWFGRTQFDAYLDAFGLILMRAGTNTLRLLFDVSNASVGVDPRFVVWQSRFSTEMRPQFETKIERTAIVLTNSVVRSLLNGYFARCPATRPKKFFASRAEAEAGLVAGWPS